MFQKIRQILQFTWRNPKVLLIVALIPFIYWTHLKIVNYINKALSSPTVVATSPLGGDIEVSLDFGVSITFSRPMRQETVEQSFSIEPAVQGNFSWSGNTVTFIPDSDFKRDQTVKVTLSKGARARNLSSLRQNHVFTFKTLSNPHIALASPRGNIAGPVENIVVMFNKSVKRTEGVVLEVTPEIQGEGKWVGSAAYVIKPENLVTGQKYTVELVQDLESVDGGILEKGYTFEFVNYAPAAYHMDSSGGLPDYYYNANSADKNPNGPITVYFNQKVNKQDIIDKFTLRSTAHMDFSPEVPVRAVFSDRTKGDDLPYYQDEWSRNWKQKVSFYPLSPLKPLTTYKASLAQGFLNESSRATAEYGIDHVFTTANLPGFVFSNIKDGDVDVGQDTRLELTFKSPMDPKEVQRNFQVKIGGVVDNSSAYFGVDYGGKVVGYSKFLKRSTDFQFYLPSHTRDKFGRSIGEDVHISFKTAPYKPSFGLQPGNTYFATVASNVDTRFIGRGVNISKLKYNVYEISLEQLMDLNKLYRNEWSLINGEKAAALGYNLYGSWVYELDLDRDVHTDILYNLNTEAGVDLKPGIYFLDVEVADGIFPVQNVHDNMVFIVGDVSIGTKTSHSNVLVWATGLEKAEVKKDYNVAVYKTSYPTLKHLPEGSPGSLPEPIVKGKTNEHGVLFHEGSQLSDNGPYLVVVQKDGDIGVSFSNWDSGISPYEFEGVTYSYSLKEKGPQEYKAFAFTDRTLYRPGDEVQFEAFLRNNNLHTFSMPPGDTPITINVSKLYDYQQDSIYSETFKDVSDGSVSGSFTLPESVDLDRYSLKVLVNGEQYYAANFDIQEYVVPEFEVLANVPQEDVIRGDGITLNAVARYFYGAPVVKADTDYRLYKRNYIFNWPDDSSYKFYSMKRYYEGDNIWRGFEEKEVIEASGQTDREGKLGINVGSDTDSGVSQIFTFETDILGESGRKITGSNEYIVHMAEHYTGIKSESYVGIVDEDSKFQVKTVNVDGTDARDISVGVSIYKRSYFRVKKQDNSEGYFYEYSYKDELVDTKHVKTDSKGEAEFGFKPNEGGYHIIQVESRDNRGNLSTSDIGLYVGSSESSGFWRRANHDRVELVTDKDEYEIGDKATIVATSTLENTIGLLTVEAEDIMEYKVFKQNTSSDTISLDIREDYMPNVYISALFVEPGTSVYDPAEFRMGTRKVQVNTEKNILEVDIETSKDRYSPKETGQGKVIVKDHAGVRMPNTSVTVALVDDALLTMAPLKRENAFTHFYSKRDLGVLTFHNLTMSLDRINANTDIGAKGGSGSKGGAGGDYIDLTREDFSETALWLATVKTNGDGEAKFDFTLPDSTTRWNLFALAQSSGGGRFGQSIHKFGASLDIFGMPALPRFVRVGDEFNLSVVVHNNAEDRQDIEVGIESEGFSLSDNNYSKNISVGANSTEKVVFPAVAGEEGSATVTFTLSKNGNYKDVVKKEFPILPYGLEIISSMSNIVNYEASEEFEVNPVANKNHGGLTTEVYSSFVGVAEKNLLNLQEQSHYLSTERVSSILMGMVYKHKFYKEQYGEDDPDSAASAKSNIANLLNLQRADGGWGYWKDSTYSDIYNTAVAVEALLEAEQAGFSFELSAINRGIKYLQDNFGQVTSNYDNQPYFLYVLELGGADQTGRIQQLYERRQSISDFSKAYLIRAMEASNQNWGKFIPQLISELIERADLASQRVFWSKSRIGWYCQDDKSVTAVVLRAFNLVDPNSPAAGLAIKYLAQEDRQTYYSTYTLKLRAVSLFENAIQRGIKPRNTKVEFILNENSVGSGEFLKKDKNAQFEHFVPVNELLEGTNKTTIRLDKGGSAYYGMVLKTLLPFESIQSGSNDIGLEREFLDVEGNVVRGNKFVAGESYVVRLTIATPNMRRNLVLEDYLPGGFESVNGTLTNESSLTTEKAAQISQDNKETEQLWVSNLQMHDSQTDIYLDYIGKGLYEYTYVVKATVPGVYKLRPAQIYESYSPDIRANTTGGLVQVVD